MHPHRSHMRVGSARHYHNSFVPMVFLRFVGLVGFCTSCGVGGGGGLSDAWFVALLWGSGSTHWVVRSS